MFLFTWITRTEARRFARKHWHLEDNQPGCVPYVSLGSVVWMFGALVGLAGLVAWVVWR